MPYLRTKCVYIIRELKSTILEPCGTCFWFKSMHMVTDRHTHKLTTVNLHILAEGSRPVLDYRVQTSILSLATYNTHPSANSLFFWCSH